MTADILEFDRWFEVTRGIYRFVVNAGVYYEIHILYHSKDTDIRTAKASLYAVKDYLNESKANCYERKCLLNEQPVFECMQRALKDCAEIAKGADE